MPRKAKKGKFKLKTHKATSKRSKVLLSEMLPVQGRSYIKRIKRLAPNMEE